jgi:hypothetical protein
VRAILSCRPLAVGFLVFLLALTAGCGGPGRGSVKGKITVQGKPLPRALITFLPEGGNRDPVNAAIINGEFETPDMPAGLAKAYITPPQTEEPPPVDKGDLSPVARSGRKGLLVVPEKYGNPATSGLSLTVQKGENKFDADLTP